MYKKDAADVGRYRTTHAIELHRDEYELAAVEETWSVQKKIMAPIWDQVRDTSLAILNTLNLEIARRLKVKMVPSSVQGVGQTADEIAEQVVLPTAVTQITQAVPVTGVLMAIPNLIRGIQLSQDAERTDDRYKAASEMAKNLVAAWENAAAKAMTVISQAGVTTLITPTPEEADYILRYLLKLQQAHPAWPGAWGNRFTGGDNRAQQIKELQPVITNPKFTGAVYDKLRRDATYPFWGLGGIDFGAMIRAAYQVKQYAEHGLKGSRAAAWTGAATLLIDNLAVRLSKMVTMDAPVQAQVTAAVSEQVTSASPTDSVIQRVLDENVQRAQESQHEEAERLFEPQTTDVQELMEQSARQRRVLDEGGSQTQEAGPPAPSGPAPPGLARKPGFLDWVLSRARFGTRSA